MRLISVELATPSTPSVGRADIVEVATESVEDTAVAFKMALESMGDEVAVAAGTVAFEIVVE